MQKVMKAPIDLREGDVTPWYTVMGRGEYTRHGFVAPIKHHASEGGEEGIRAFETDRATAQQVPVLVEEGEGDG